jgi:formamidopyrimidine-DNA glycosylase
MDQHRIAGIGNVYADEILFQARTAPDLKANAIAERRLEGIRQIMRRVLKKAVEVEADRSRMPRGWLTPRRSAGEACPRCGGEIATKQVGGRTAHFCPSCQRA